jgi:hypothetical protein
MKMIGRDTAGAGNIVNDSVIEFLNNPVEPFNKATTSSCQPDHCQAVAGHGVPPLLHRDHPLQLQDMKTARRMY